MAGSLLSAHQISAGIYAQRRLFTENENDLKVFLIVMAFSLGLESTFPKVIAFSQEFSVCSVYSISEGWKELI